MPRVSAHRDPSVVVQARRVVPNHLPRTTRAMRDEAREHLATARMMHRELGMTYWLEKTEAGLGPIGARSDRATAGHGPEPIFREGWTGRVRQSCQ